MTTSIIETYSPTNLREMRDAIDEMIATASVEGGVAGGEIIYVREGMKLALEREALTDGSIVFNVLFWSRPAAAA